MSSNPTSGSGGSAGNPPAACPLAPGLASPDNLIDYNSPAGAKLWKAHTEPLSDKFDGSPSKLRVFIADVQRRAQTAGWNKITTIEVNQTNRDLFKEYGLIDLKHVHAAAIKVFANRDRSTQNSAQMYTFLFDSVSESLKSRLLTRQEDYIVGNSMHDGPSLFKTILTIAKVHTRSTSSHVRQALMSLEEYMKDKAKYDIIAFNQYVQECRDDLASYGEQADDLLLYLFKGYQATTDSEFNQYIRDKQNSYNEGTDMTVSELMANAELKYKTLVQAGAWCSPSPEQQQIVALQSQLVLMAQAAAKRQGNSNDNGPSAKKARLPALPDDHWKYKNPDKAATKAKNGKTYHWCPNHKKGMWVLHHPSECRIGQRNTPTDRPTSTPPLTPSPSTQTAFAAILHDYLNDE